MNIMDNYNQSGYGYNQSEQTVVSDYPAEGNIVVNNNAKYTLDSITKWVKFLAILGIIGKNLSANAGHMGWIPDPGRFYMQWGR